MFILQSLRIFTDFHIAKVIIYKKNEENGKIPIIIEKLKNNLA